MYYLRYVVIGVAILLTGRSSAEDSVPEFITAWHRETADVTSVRASVNVTSNDLKFDIQKHAKGTFGYRSPTHGFWNSVNDSTPSSKRRLSRHGIPYTIQPFEPEHLRWCNNRVRNIDDANRSFTEVEIPLDVDEDIDSGRWFNWFINPNSFRTVAWGNPFLPGRPNKDVAALWTYTVTKQSDSRVMVRAVPKADTPFCRCFQSCDLYFQRQPVRLLATRSTDPGGERQTTSIYTDVDFAPEAWPEPDLAGYEPATRSGQ